MTAVDEPAGPPPRPSPALSSLLPLTAPPGPIWSAETEELARSWPAQVMSERETITSGTLPLALIFVPAVTVSDWTTTRLTVLPSNCLTTSIGLVKQSLLGPDESVSMLQSLVTFSA